MRWNALILAGSRGPTDPVAQAAGVTDKAMAEVAGRPMIHHVFDALHGTGRIDRIAVIGGRDLDLAPDIGHLDAAPSPAGSVQQGLSALGTPLLVTTADNPLVRPETIDAFLSGAEAMDADAVAGIARRCVVEAAGNPARRTYLRFRDGPVSGCNLFAFATPQGAEAARFWRRLETQRKQPWRMAMAIGPGVLLRYVFGRLDQDMAARAISRAAGCRTAMVALDDPFAAHDVDKPDDLRFADTVLIRRQQDR